uniref:Photosystem I assembly protein Ycf3 n=2 Tax=Chaetoceros TaxID=49237 RepID=A0A8K1ZPZ5_9STRA|nr:photosystem I assembly protein Ycf3 [Chaetoceros muellerii]QOK36004.1 photosystem I assembly protein Ycf3 [Chaetoceros muellerii]UHB41333.1 photosystem I assembly protein Ycf3 [Chaetoceros sp. DS1]
MGNFIDKTFTVIADILLKVLPASKQEKQAFSYYRAGMAAQSNGKYAEALENYYEALQVEEDPYDRSYTLYNIGLIYGNIGNNSQALEYYHQALELNSNLPQALNNIAVIYHSSGLNTLTMINEDINDVQQAEYRALATEFFDKAGEYWRQALKLAPDNYPGARNWLKVSGRLFDEE